MAGVVAGAWAGFHRMSLKTQKKIVRVEPRSKRRLRRSRRSPPPTSADTAPFGLVVGRTPTAAIWHGVLGSTSTGEKELGLAKVWKVEDLVKG
jgi:hypothetical protein